MKTLFGILKEIKQSQLVEMTNAIAEMRSPDRASKAKAAEKYTEDDLKEHLKLTCSIIIDDVSEHWKSYDEKFKQAQEQRQAEQNKAKYKVSAPKDARNAL